VIAPYAPGGTDTVCPAATAMLVELGDTLTGGGRTRGCVGKVVAAKRAVGATFIAGAATLEAAVTLDSARITTSEPLPMSPSVTSV
jgi:hypothetical protein